MIKLYQVTSNTVTRQARMFLNKYDLDFKTYKVCKETFSFKDFCNILSLTDGGVYDLLSDRSTYYKELRNKNFDLDSLKLSELHQLILEHPSLLKTPIILNMDDSKIVIGNNSEMMLKLVPKKLR